MANYTIFTFETLNLLTVDVDTDFAIYRYATSTPGAMTTNLVFSGRIVAGYSLQHLDEILSQYVYTENLVYAASPYVIQDDEQRFTFYIYYSTDDWAHYSTDTVTVIYDWSYEFEPTAVRSTKSSIPINFMDPRQFAIQSMMSRDGSEEPVQVVLDSATIDNFTIDGTSTFTYFRPLKFAIDDPTIEHTLSIAGINYTVKPTCYNYALYYLNQWGGYDYMLFGGRELQTDNISRLSYKQKYVVNTPLFGQTDYQATIQRRWSFNTSWLNDTQAEKLKHLFSSNKIWLQDLTMDTKLSHIIPVNITNTSFEHKNWRNQGRKLYSYTIEVSASQPQFRV